MPKTEVVFYADKNGRCPALEWMDTIPQKAQEKCIVKVERLAQMGHELRRPEADYLRDNIYELRAALHRIQYRLLYFFHYQKGIITIGLIKRGNIVPHGDIDLTLQMKTRYENNPSKHTFRG